MEKGVFDTDLARNMEVEVASMNEGNVNDDSKGSNSCEDSLESDEVAVQEPVRGLAKSLPRKRWRIGTANRSHQNKHFLIYVYFS